MGLRPTFFPFALAFCSALFSEEDYGTFTLGAGEFAIFFPTDAHAPKMKNAGNSTIEKIVVKVRVE